MERRLISLAVLVPLTLSSQPAFPVKDIDSRVGLSGANSSGFTQVGTTIFFSSGRAVWRTDGSAAGTRLLREIGFNIAEGPTCLQALGGKVFFLGDEDSTGTQLWQSDGTIAGTKLVAETGGGTGIVACPVIANGSLFFTVSNGLGSFAGFWKSDGTALKDLARFVKELRASDEVAVEITDNTRLLHDVVAPHVKRVVVVDTNQFRVIRQSVKKPTTGNPGNCFPLSSPSSGVRWQNGARRQGFASLRQHRPRPCPVRTVLQEDHSRRTAPPGTRYSAVSSSWERREPGCS